MNFLMFCAVISLITLCIYVIIDRICKSVEHNAIYKSFGEAMKNLPKSDFEKFMTMIRDMGTKKEEK